MKKPVVSFFFEQYNSLMSIKDAESLFNTVTTLTNESRINEQDKRKVLYDISLVKEDLEGLQRYITNSMLKYQSNGVISLLPR